MGESGHGQADVLPKMKKKHLRGQPINDATHLGAGRREFCDDMRKGLRYTGIFKVTKELMELDV